VLEVRSVKGFAVVVRPEFMSLCVGCAVAGLKIFRREGRKKLKFLSGWKRGKLFCNFWSVHGLVRIANVLDPVRLLFFFPTIISILICPPIQWRYQYRSKY